MERSLFPRRTTAPHGKTSFSSKSRATKVLKWSVSCPRRSTTTSGETRGPNTAQSAFPSACAGRVNPVAYSGLRRPSGVSGSGISSGREKPSRSRMWVVGTPIRVSSAIPRFSRVAEAITTTSAVRARAAATNSLAWRSAPQTSTRRPGGNPSSSRMARGFRPPEEDLLLAHPYPAGVHDETAPSWKNVSLYSPFSGFSGGSEEGERTAGGEDGYEQRENLPAGVLEDLIHRLPPFASKTGPPERFASSLHLRVRHPRGDPAERLFRDRAAVDEGVGNSPRDQIPRQIRVGADQRGPAPRGISRSGLRGNLSLFPSHHEDRVPGPHREPLRHRPVRRPICQEHGGKPLRRVVRRAPVTGTAPPWSRRRPAFIRRRSRPDVPAGPRVQDDHLADLDRRDARSGVDHDPQGVAPRHVHGRGVAFPEYRHRKPERGEVRVKLGRSPRSPRGRGSPRSASARCGKILHANGPGRRAVPVAVDR